MVFDPSQPYNLPTIVVALFILRALVGLIGIIFNLDLVYIICSNRSLHSSCSLLLALQAFCDALYEFSFITNGVIATGLTPGSGAQVIRLQTCLFIQIVPTFGANSSIMLTLAIGLDRLLHAVFPIFFFHRTESRSLLYYSMVLAGFCFSYGFYIVYGSIKTVFASRVERYVICGIQDLYIDNLANDIVRNNLIWNMLTVVCYLAVGIVLKQRKSNAATDHATRRLFMSLFFTMILNFFGWFIYSMFSLALTYFIKLDTMQKWCVGGSLAIVMALASFSCAPLLYTFSRDYRRAFQRQFWTIGRCIGLNASYFAASKDNSHVF
ncbi:serpentine type 7TM GPCR chemoreceptor srsx domain-containing protein [Ditylenchus destructor]|nr:serpentine type 7TM GPCR chemoreceptor srsx domain-containing protein [Ditylenchus destructor]